MGASKKQIILISEDEELYKSFKRALNIGSKTTTGLELAWSENIGKLLDSSSLEDKRIVIFLQAKDISEMRRYRNLIRVKKIYNPFVAIVFGSQQKGDFINDEHHCYIDIPFELERLSAIINKVRPIPSSEKLSDCIVNWLRNNSHDIQDMLLGKKNGRNRAIELIKEIVPSFNLSDNISKQKEKILNMLNDKKIPIHVIAKEISVLFENLKRLQEVINE